MGGDWLGDAAAETGMRTMVEALSRCVADLEAVEDCIDDTIEDNA